MSYSTAEKMKEELRQLAHVPTAPRPAHGEDREGAVAALRSLSQQATQLATQLERGQLSENTVHEVWEHIDLATRVMVEATRLAFNALRR